MNTPTYPTKEDLIDFVYDEVHLLDEGRYKDWLELWTEEGYYWMPLDYNQQDPKLVTSFMYEDQFMLRLRVERLAGERTFSQKPRSRCHHVIQRPRIEQTDAGKGAYVIKTAMHYVETRLDEQFLLAINATHHLILRENRLRILLKRVDLLNCDAAFGNIQLIP